MRHKLGMIADGTSTGRSGALVALQRRRSTGRQGARARHRWRRRTREDEITDWLEARRRRRLGDSPRPSSRPGSTRRGSSKCATTVGRRHSRERHAVAELHGRDRAADERDRGLHHPGLHPRRSGQAVLAARPGPFQVVDVHELLDSTLLMLRENRPGIKVVKDYDRRCPDTRPTPPSSTRCGRT